MFFSLAVLELIISFKVKYFGLYIYLSLYSHIIIRFEDPEVLRVLCEVPCYADYDGSSFGSLRLVDADGDGMITLDEVENIGLLTNRNDKNFSIFINNTKITSFNEFRFFTNLKIYNSTFSGCTNLKNVELPAVTEYWGSMFQGTAIEEIIVPEGVEFIDQGFGWDCNYLRFLSLPSTIKTLTQSNAFLSHTASMTVICKAITPPDFPGGWGYQTIIKAIYVPDDSVDLYKSANTWSQKASVIYPLS